MTPALALIWLGAIAILALMRGVRAYAFQGLLMILMGCAIYPSSGSMRLVVIGLAWLPMVLLASKAHRRFRENYQKKSASREGS